MNVIDYIWHNIKMFIEKKGIEKGLKNKGIEKIEVDAWTYKYLKQCNALKMNGLEIQKNEKLIKQAVCMYIDGERECFTTTGMKHIIEGNND